MVLAQKFLARKEDAIRDKDEWSYIGITGNQSEIKDVMNVRDRQLSFSQEAKISPTKWNKTTEEIRWALDAAGNAGQYIKYFNMKVEKHNKQISKLKKIQNDFEQEVNELNSYKLEKISTDKESLSKMDSKKITLLLDQLLLQKRLTTRKLVKLRKQFSSIESDLKSQEIQIKKIRKELSARIFNGEDTVGILDELDAIQVIRQELSSLSKKHDVERLTCAIESVISN